MVGTKSKNLARRRKNYISASKKKKDDIGKNGHACITNLKSLFHLEKMLRRNAVNDRIIQNINRKENS